MYYCMCVCIHTSVLNRTEGRTQDLMNADLAMAPSHERYRFDWPIGRVIREALELLLRVCMCERAHIHMHSTGLTILTRLVWNSHRSIGLCFPSVGIKYVLYHTRSFLSVVCFSF